MVFRIDNLRGTNFAAQTSEVNAANTKVSEDVFTEAKNAKSVPEEDPQQAKIRVAMEKSAALAAQIVEITPEMTPEEVIATLRANAEIKLQQYNIESAVGTNTATILLAEHDQCLYEADYLEAQQNGTLKTEFGADYTAELRRLASEITPTARDLNELRINAAKKVEMIRLARENGDLEAMCALNRDLIQILNDIRMAEYHEMRSE